LRISGILQGLPRKLQHRGSSNGRHSSGGFFHGAETSQNLDSGFHLR